MSPPKEEDRPEEKPPRKRSGHERLQTCFAWCGKEQPKQRAAGAKTHPSLEQMLLQEGFAAQRVLEDRLCDAGLPGTVAQGGILAFPRHPRFLSEHT